jgi:hypothetical protein
MNTNILKSLPQFHVQEVTKTLSNWSSSKVQSKISWTDSYHQSLVQKSSNVFQQ